MPKIMPGSGGAARTGMYDIALARANRSSRYHRSCWRRVPTMTPKTASARRPATITSGTTAMRPAPHPVAPADEMTLAMTETNTITNEPPTIATTNTTTMIATTDDAEPNTPGVRPEARSRCTCARTAPGSTGSVSGRASKGTDAVSSVMRPRYPPSAAGSERASGVGAGLGILFHRLFGAEEEEQTAVRLELDGEALEVVDA